MTTERPSRRARMWAGVVALVALAVYAPTVGHGFVFDDEIVIEKNLDVRSLTTIPDIFRHGEWEGGGRDNGLYRPLTSTTYALNYALTGLQPWSYHLGNVLLHAVASVLVLSLGLAWRLPVEAAGVGALLFAAHPIHVEAVANVIGRKELLAAIFLVLMFLAHRGALRRRGPAVVLAPLAYACAMLSKEVGAVGLALVALGDMTTRTPSDDVAPARKRAIGLYATYGVSLVLFVALHRAIVGSLQADTVLEIDNPAAQASTVVRWMTAVAVVGKGLALQIAPLNQSPDYSFEQLPLADSPLDPRFVLALVAVSAWLGAGLRWRRTAPVVVLGAGWYGLSLLPASNILFATGTIFGERLLYVPSVGLSLVAGWILYTFLGRRSLPAMFVTAGTVAAALAFGAVAYGAAWKDDFTLFSRAIVSAPRSAKVQHLFGRELFHRGVYGEAERALRRSLEIWPEGHNSLGLLGELYRVTGRRAEAADMFRAALELEPNNAGALYGLGRLARDGGDLETAERYWLEALAADPRQPGALSDLGALAYTRGDRAGALDYWTRTVLYAPEQASAWYNLGLLHRETGSAAESRRAFEEFLRTAGSEYPQAVQEVRALLGR